MVVVGALRVACYWELQVLPVIELSPVGFNMVNCLKHIYPWWIWFSNTIFIDVGVIIVIWGLNKFGSLFGSFLALANTMKVYYFVT